MSETAQNDTLKIAGYCKNYYHFLKEKMLSVLLILMLWRQYIELKASTPSGHMQDQLISNGSIR